MTGVVLPDPPPTGKVDPQFVALAQGEVVHRIYNPEWHNATANGFRYEGPLARFDHHQAPDVRGIVYGAKDLGGALIQAFGKNVRFALSRRYSTVVLEKTVRLLDLRGEAASEAGTSKLIATAPFLTTAQRWSRFFYINPDFVQPDGLVYTLHNERTVYAFFDRTFEKRDVGKILGYPQFDYSLSDPKVRGDCVRWARALGLTIDFDTTEDPDAP